MRYSALERQVKDTVLMSVADYNMMHHSSYLIDETRDRDGLNLTVAGESGGLLNVIIGLYDGREMVHVPHSRHFSEHSVYALVIRKIENLLEPSLITVSRDPDCR